MEAHTDRWHQDYERNVFIHVGMWVLVFASLIGFWKDIEKAWSIVVGFGVVWACYRYASKQLDTTGNIRVWFASLVKVTVVRLISAAVLMGSLFWLKGRIPTMPIESAYVVFGFVFSIVVYRVRVVLGEVKNV